MSTSPIGSSSSATSSNAYKTGDQLQSLGGSSQLQVTGLASGLDTNAIVTAMMATATQQVTNLQNQQTGITTLNSQLTSIQSALQKVANDAQALGSPSLFANTQSVNSSNSSLVGATLTSGASALIGTYQVSVQALATASQQTYTFNSPTSASDTITFGSGSGAPTVTLAAGATADDLVNAINSNSNLPVWATVTQEPPSSGGQATIVFSDRNTGAPPTSGGQPTYTQITDSAGALSADQSVAPVPGTDAQYTINGTTYYSSSNTISGNSLGTGSTPTEGQGAQQTIPGVTLSLNALTGSTPLTISVGTPAPNSQNIQAAVQQLVTDYNSAITQIQNQLTQTPSSSDPTQGTLYDDPDLQQLLSSMRGMMDKSFNESGNITSMLDVGVSTGATTGTGAISATSLLGDLTLNASTLTSALQSNPSGVQSMLTSWSINFSSLVNNEAAPGGTIDSRIQADDTQSSYLGTQIENMQNANAQQQQELVQQFANMEAALSQSQSTSSWLTSQLSSLPGG
jgi:flagellar hook-associated protein 2